MCPAKPWGTNMDVGGGIHVCGVHTNITGEFCPLCPPPSNHLMSSVIILWSELFYSESCSVQKTARGGQSEIRIVQPKIFTWDLKSDDAWVRTGRTAANQETSWLRNKEACGNKNRHIGAASRIFLCSHILYLGFSSRNSPYATITSSSMLHAAFPFAPMVFSFVFCWYHVWSYKISGSEDETLSVSLEI